MHFLSKHLIALILGCVFAVSWSKLPYFPIEVSRAIASSDKSLLVLRVLGLVLVVLCQNAHDIAAWACFMIVVYADDVNYWTLHMMGVAGIAAVSYSIENSFSVFVRAALLYALRVCLRGSAVWLLEGTPLLQVPKRVLQIGYDGKSESRLLLAVFRLSGLIQWVIIWTVLDLYVVKP
jgi:hypothetical protein